MEQITVTLTVEQTRAANSIARNMKRNKKESGTELVQAKLNAFLRNDFELIAKAAKELAANSYDNAISFGAKFDIDRKSFIAKQCQEAEDILQALKGE